MSPLINSFAGRLFTVLFAAVASSTSSRATVAASDDQFVVDEEAAKALDRFVDVTGGQDAYRNLKSRVSRGTVYHSTENALALLDVYETNSTSRLWRSRCEMLGEERETSAGTQAWNHSLAAGPRLQRDTALDSLLRHAPLDSPTRWRDQYPRVESLGTEDVDGTPCHVVRLTPPTGEAETRFFSVETGLLLRADRPFPVEGNLILVRFLYDDYREVDGILVPHRVNERQADLKERRMVFESIEHDVPIDPELFEIPWQVQELME